MAAHPVDLAELAGQTGNDVKLEREVLRLYLEKSPGDLARLKAATSADERRRMAHLMTGSARAIGAAEVARLSAAIERGREVASNLAALERALADALHFIAEHLATRPAAG